MALTKPILYTQSAFDATQSHTFTFNVIGGDQVVANQLTIVNQQTSAIVYQQKQVTYTFTHVVPAGTLQNGKYYSAYVKTYNASNVASVASSSIQFYCYAEPSWGFTNIPLGGIINNSSFNFEVTYNQAQSEALSNYSISLYDSEQSLLSTSGVKYVINPALPTVVSYIFSGLKDEQLYYIRAVGTTVQGMILDTGFQQIFASYSTHDMYANIRLTNNCDGGYVSIRSNLLNIEGKSNPDPPIYIENETKVDASVAGRYVEWDESFIIEGGFTASLWGSNFAEGAQIIEFSDTNGNNIKVDYIKVSDGMYRLNMTVTEEGEVSTVYSQQEAVWANFNNQQIWIRRIGNQYTIELHNLQPTPPSQSAVLGTGLLGWMILGEE